MCHEYFRFGWKDEDLQFKDIPYHKESKRIEKKVLESVAVPEKFLNFEDQMQADIELVMMEQYTQYFARELERLQKVTAYEITILEEWEFQLARNWAKQVQGIWL
jgi:hypothetical protein